MQRLARVQPATGFAFGFFNHAQTVGVFFVSPFVQLLFPSPARVAPACQRALEDAGGVQHAMARMIARLGIEQLRQRSAFGQGGQRAEVQHIKWC